MGYYFDDNDYANGFVYDGSNYTTLNDTNGVDGTYVTGISGNNVVGYYYDSNGNANGFITSVPEPSTDALFSLGVLGLALLIRRKKARQ